MQQKRWMQSQRQRAKGQNAANVGRDHIETNNYVNRSGFDVGLTWEGFRRQVDSAVTTATTGLEEQLAAAEADYRTLEGESEDRRQEVLRLRQSLANTRLSSAWRVTAGVVVSVLIAASFLVGHLISRTKTTLVAAKSPSSASSSGSSGGRGGASVVADSPPQAQLVSMPCSGGGFVAQLGAIPAGPFAAGDAYFEARSLTARSKHFGLNADIEVSLGTAVCPGVRRGLSTAGVLVLWAGPFPDRDAAQGVCETLRFISIWDCLPSSTS